jgi:hypothetical protein
MKALVGLLMALTLLPAGSGAGELVLENGSRFGADLANETIRISTGTDLVEVLSEDVSSLTRNEVRLRDGRSVQGVLVGGHVRVRTALGELIVSAGEIRSFRTDASVTTDPAAVGIVRLASPPPVATPPAIRPLEIVAAETAVRRDALHASETVDRAVRGERVSYLDAIDRRLRILNVLVFDGGHWIKVRTPRGAEGWVPADAVQVER